jgi:hypothetical protein
VKKTYSQEQPWNPPPVDPVPLWSRTRFPCRGVLKEWTAVLRETVLADAMFNRHCRRPVSHFDIPIRQMVPYELPHQDIQFQRPFTDGS